MKKKILALFLSVQMLLSVMMPGFYVMADAAKLNDTDSVGEEQLSESDPEVVVTSIFPECTLEWTSFSDYLLNQATTAWNYPETYVGYEVEFLPYWTSIECTSGFTGNENHVWLGIKPGETKANTQIDPSEFKMVIDGYYFEEESQYLWYKVKAAEGYVLPEILEQNPYVLHLDPFALEDRLPALLIGPVKAIFNSTTGSVNIKKQSVAASHSDTVDLSLLSPIFSVSPVYVDSIFLNHYDIGDLAAEYTEYRYVEEGSITLLPAEVSAAYEKLLAAEDTYDYYDIMNDIPQSVLAQFSEHHRTALDECIEALAALEQVRYETTVDFGGVSLPVAVVGKLPEGVKLQASVVPNDTVLSEGFDVKEDLSDLVVALDIKLVYTADGTEWQPKEGRRVGVSIGLGALGYEDGSVLKLQHKHDGFIEDYEIAIVQDGALTIYTSGFSIYTVTKIDPGNPITNGATQINDKGTITLEVGKDKNNEYIFYFVTTKTTNGRGPWTLEDPTGALHYTVHSQTTFVGSGGVYAPWITIHPLKVASGIKLTFAYNEGNNGQRETYTVNVVAPKGGDKVGDKERDYKLYIKDDVNKNGKITAALVDKDGKEITDGLEGAAFEWSRSDDYLINTTAYEDNYKSVNIARDHSGLVETRKQDGKFIPTTYTLKATLSNGDDYYAYYTVYYQSEIINSDFEFPTTSKDNYYAYFPNGWPELHWKTTAPGSRDKLTMDVEYGIPTGQNADFGVPQAANGSTTLAEINAEAFGALYQDVISVPGEEIVWHFAHAPRQDPSWVSDISNAMFIVLGPTEAAQKLNADQLTALGAEAKRVAGANNTSFLNGQTPVKVTYENAEYSVWYHDAGSYDYNNGRKPDIYNEENNYGWTNLEGTYKTPANQYRTRLFFVSEKSTNGQAVNAGNLIDQANGGMYRKYLIEYYSEVLQGDNLLQLIPLKTVEGEALLHSSVHLDELEAYMKDTTHPYYLHKILINGGNYPYNIRYDGDASLYVEKYEDAEGFNRGSFGEGDYDIVMQVYLRDVATTVQSQLVFPAKMTEAQKLSVIEALNGYQTSVKVVEVSKDENGEEKEGETLDVGVATITKRDPKGNYTAYYYFNQNIYLTKGTTYRIVQNPLPEEISNKTGLILDSNNGTQYYTNYYENGAIAETVPNANIKLSDTRGFAEVVIVNKFKEKETTIYYKAVGHGKVAFNDPNITEDNLLDYLDAPYEKIDYYTEKAIGAKVFAGEGATFIGWFKDEACTDPVTPADGVVDGNSFIPNANIINDTEITFYAKFETGSVVINRKNAEPGQTFVYNVQWSDSRGNEMNMYVSLKCDATGSGTVAILEASTAGTYTVTELKDWSWRYAGEELTGSHQGADKELVFTFDNTVTNNKWLNSYGELSSNTN